MSRYIRRTAKGLAIFFGIILILYGAAYFYVLANKKEILAKVTSEISDKLDGIVTVENMELTFLTNFPRASVLLERVEIKDTLFGRHKHPFFKAEKVVARISAIKLVSGGEPLNGVEVENGQLYVYTDTAGYTNSYLLSGKKKIGTPKSGKVDGTVIKKVKLKNVRLTLNNERDNKLFDFSIKRLVADVDPSPANIAVEADVDMLVHHLGFNLKMGSYLRSKTFEGELDVYFDKVHQVLTFNNQRPKIDGHPFTISGRFDLSPNKKFDLKIASKKLHLDAARSLLTDKISKAIAMVSLKNPVDASANISGPLKAGDPLVVVNWTSGSNNVSTPFVQFTDASFSGGFTNEVVKGQPRKDPNSKIWVKNFKGNWEGLTLQSNQININNLKEPMISCDLRSAFGLQQLNNLLQSNSIQLTKGQGELDITYTGPLQKNNADNSKINGTLKANNGEVLYVPRNVTMQNTSGFIVFRNADVIVKDLRSQVQGNQLIMNGSAANVLALMKTNPGKVSLDWHVYSPSLNLATFTNLLKKRQKTVARSRSNKALGKTAEQIDKVLDESNVRLQLKAGAVQFKKFTASNVNALIALTQENWDLKNVSMLHGGGAMRFSGFVHEIDHRYHDVKMNVSTSNVDIGKLLYSFENFGQDGIEHANVKGKLTSDVVVNMNLDREMTAAPTNLSGQVKFSLRQGALINYEPLQKLKSFFKNRDFSNIQFAELKNTLDIKKEEIIINRMEIQSTALTLYVEGVYSMKGNSDIRIQVPIKNLRKRDEAYVPVNKGADKDAGTSIFLRGKPGDDGNIKFKLDLLGKIRQKL